MKKYICAVVFIIAAAALRPVLQRELWFDEALTLLNFVLPLELGKIYFSYTIPNNQIVYSIMLKIWDMFYIGYTSITVFWRLLSVISAFGMFAVLLYLNKNIDKKRSFSAVFVIVIFLALYATSESNRICLFIVCPFKSNVISLYFAIGSLKSSS